jgi:Zn-dependent membrane protease YugP
MFFPGYWWWSPWELLTIPGLLLGFYAQFKLRSVYSRYLTVGTRSGLSGAEAAREILDHAGLTGMPIEEIPGELSDHYDPASKALFLSSENFHGRSVSAVGVAAREAGHALQQKAAYAPFNFRMMVVPVAQIANWTWPALFMLGFVLGGHLFHPIINISIGIFSFFALLQVVTLPVEYDASRRAKQQLVSLGLVQADEAPGVGKVLNAAALTYVAALVVALLQLLKLIMIANSSRNNRN